MPTVKIRQRNRLQVENHRQRIGTMLAPFGVNESGIRLIVDARHRTPEFVSDRIERMRQAGVPLTGITSKLSITNPLFEALIRRYSERHGMTNAQHALYNLMLAKGASGETALRLAGNCGKPGEMQKRIAFFESIKLDPNRYGVERIPFSMYKNRLRKTTGEIVRGGSFKRDILHVLEGRHVAKQLSKLMPGWDGFIILQKYLPSTLLKRVNAAVKNGMKLTPGLIANNTDEAIAAGKAIVPGFLRRKELARSIMPNRQAASSKTNFKNRQLIVRVIASKPGFTVNEAWLQQHLKLKHKITRQAFQSALESLSKLKVTAKSGGCIMITKRFRAG